MSSSSEAHLGSERERQTNAAGRRSGRAQRRAAAEQATRRMQLLMLAGAIVGAVVVALILIVLNRPQPAGAPIQIAEALPESVPVSGQTMGQADAPVTVTEWGDYNCPHCQEFTRLGWNRR